MKVNWKKGAVLFSIYGSNAHLGHTQAGIIEDVIISENSGPMTKFEGCSYLFKGYLFPRTLYQLGATKDVSWFVFGLRVAVPYLVFLYIFNKHKFVNVCDKYFKLAYEPLKKMDVIPQPYEWCTSVKEFYRVSEILLNEVKHKGVREVLGKFRDLALMILENDTAYRFVAQDVIPEIDKNKDLIDELKRVYRVMIFREHPGDQRNKWIRIEKLMLLVLRVPKIRKLVRKYLTELDFEKIKLDEADWYFVLGHHLYDYQDVSYEDRMAERMRINKEKNHHIPILQIQEDNTGKKLMIVGYER